MWGFVSKAIAGTSGLTIDSRRPNQSSSDSSSDEVSITGSREEGLECPICCESFNIVENVPYVLWCGHTLCKHCVLGLQWAVVKFPTLPIQLPFLISCPWCNLLSFRLVYKGNLKYPQKNYFLLWMVESLNGDRVKSLSISSDGDSDHRHHNETHSVWPWNRSVDPRIHDSNHHHHQNETHSTDLDAERLQYSSLRKSLIFFLNLTSKFPLVFIFLLIVIYAIPASIAIIFVYILITILFAIPSFLVLYFAYPSLDWLVSEIIA